MEKCRGIIMFLAVVAVVTVAALPCSAADEKDDEKSIWDENEGRGPRSGRGRFELTDQEKDRLLESVRKRDPEKAKEIAAFREKDPGRFREELRRHGRKEYDKVMRERFEKLRQERRDEFLAFLAKSVPSVAEDMAKLKVQNPDLYTKKFDLVRRKYDRAFQESRRNPELAEILLEDLKLKERSEYLVRKIKTTKSERDKKRLTAQLERVLSDRYDLIVRQKIIAYERLLGWLESLQNRIKKSKTEIREAEKQEVKAENIKQRMKDLLEGSEGFPW